jgi:predicted ATPase
MILKSLWICNYKCISESGEVRLEPGATCLVGKNESGKTACLEALYRLNPLPSGHRTLFQELHDYPRRRRAADKKKIPYTKPIEALFELEDADIAAVENSFGANILKTRKIKVSKNYDNSTDVDVEIDEEAFVKHLPTRGSLFKKLASGVSTINGLRQKLEGVDELPASAKKLLPRLTADDLYGGVKELLKSRLPKFLYFDEYTKLPGRFSIPYLQYTDESELGVGERTALALLRLAGVDTNEFVERNYEARKAALEAAAGQITDEVFEFWTQNKNLRVDFDVDPKTTFDSDRPAPFLEVRIWNDRHRVSLNFDERSRGFVWFFSFLAYFSEFRNRENPPILLLDEPGLGLHGSAQADLLRYINERLAPNGQVIYTTHSPFMVKATDWQAVRTVEDHDSTGTKVSDDVLGVSADTAFPLQAALGYRLAQTLLVGPNSIVVEGPADMLYLQILSAHLRKTEGIALDPKWILVPAGGLDKIPTFVALLGTHLNLAAVLNGAAREPEKIDTMVKHGLLEPNKLFSLTDVTGGSEADVEDMFEPGFYLELLRGSGVADLKLEELPADGRIVKRVEEKLGSTFDHYQPATYFLREQVKLLPKVGKQTVERFQKLFKKINTALA